MGKAMQSGRCMSGTVEYTNPEQYEVAWSREKGLPGIAVGINVDVRTDAQHVKYRTFAHSNIRVVADRPDSQHGICKPFEHVNGFQNGLVMPNLPPLPASKPSTKRAKDPRVIGRVRIQIGYMAMAISGPSISAKALNMPFATFEFKFQDARVHPDAGITNRSTTSQTVPDGPIPAGACPSSSASGSTSAMGTEHSTTMPPFGSQGGTISGTTTHESAHSTMATKAQKRARPKDGFGSTPADNNTEVDDIQADLREAIKLSNENERLTTGSSKLREILRAELDSLKEMNRQLEEDNDTYAMAIAALKRRRIS